jgi:hypothetical protein
LNIQRHLLVNQNTGQNGRVSGFKDFEPARSTLAHTSVNRGSYPVCPFRSVHGLGLAPTEMTRTDGVVKPTSPTHRPGDYNKTMRILSLDFDPLYGDENVRAHFGSDHSVFDFDMVIWDPQASFSHYISSYDNYFQGLPSLSEHTSVRIKADASRRRAEFVDFINSGRTLVVITRPQQVCYVDTGERSYSGTGRNQRTTRHVDKFDLLSALPTSKPSFLKASGDRIEYVGDGPLVRVLRDFKEYIAYQAVIKDAPGTLIAKVTGTERSVACAMKTAGGGHLILLPEIDLASYDEDDEGDEEEGTQYVERAAEFQERLLDALEQMSGTRVLSRPAWASNFATAEQQSLRDEIVKQQSRVESARAKLAGLQRESEAAEAKDQLYLGTGRALELEVKAVLELLGGTVVEPEPGRDDWKVEFPEGRAVVEVKGLSKSAAEKHAAQLEKWVAGELEETGKAPKGILVANTWRETPLPDRTKADFPPQMLPYSTGRGHCLVTGLQLFVIQAEIEADSSKAAKWRKALMKTAGILDGAGNWADIVKESTAGD